jgi:hypothetical protein
LWAYWPRKIVALLGQHTELVTNVLSKVVPFSISSSLRFGMCSSVCGVRSPAARSSAGITIMFGGSRSSPTFAPPASDSCASEPASPPSLGCGTAAGQQRHCGGQHQNRTRNVLRVRGCLEEGGHASVPRQGTAGVLQDVLFPHGLQDFLVRVGYVLRYLGVLLDVEEQRL